MGAKGGAAAPVALSAERGQARSVAATKRTGAQVAAALFVRPFTPILTLRLIPRLAPQSASRDKH